MHLSAPPPTPQALLQLASSYAFERCVTPDCITLHQPSHAPRSAAEMKAAEELFRVLDLYLWLYDRLGVPGVFRGRRQVLQQRQQVAELINSALRRMGGLDQGAAAAAMAEAAAAAGGRGEAENGDAGATAVPADWQCGVGGDGAEGRASGRGSESASYSSSRSDSMAAAFVGAV